MRFAYVPFLRELRELLQLPRGPARFAAYTARLQRDLPDVPLPLTIFNPMARDHVAAQLDELLGLDADTLADEVLRAAASELDFGTGPRIRVALVLADDARGGWTDRVLTDARYRWQDDGPMKSGWAPAILWSSEGISPALVREAVRAAMFRAAAQATRGLPRTLAEVLAQEGRAAVFAGARQPELAADDLAFTRAVLTPLLTSSHAPTIAAALYGDAAARSVGYAPLGLSPWAGLALARAQTAGQAGVG